jgi:hypothetical protein
MNRIRGISELKTMPREDNFAIFLKLFGQFVLMMHRNLDSLGRKLLIRAPKPPPKKHWGTQ